MKILIATTNPHKLDEISAVMGDEVVLCTLKDIDLTIDEPVEDQDTFEGNALLKAEYYAKASGLPTMADDSGLEVDAMGGRPGVYSARFAAEDHVGDWSSMDRSQRDLANNAKLLKDLEGVASVDRTARFVCAMAMVMPEMEGGWTAEPMVVRGTYEGSIILPEQADDKERPELGRGKHGFGYDPLFWVSAERYPAHAGKTSSELDPAEKNAISHRGDATRLLTQRLRERGLV